MKQIIIHTIGIGVSVFLLLFFVCVSWIGYDVKSQCQDAKRKYQGDCVEALITTLNNEGEGKRVRNDAIWALGQLGDRRALSTLKAHYTGVIPSREPLNKVISQYELKKAINLTSGGTNITAIFWRRNIR